MTSRRPCASRHVAEVTALNKRVGWVSWIGVGITTYQERAGDDPGSGHSCYDGVQARLKPSTQLDYGYKMAEAKL